MSIPMMAFLARPYYHKVLKYFLLFMCVIAVYSPGPMLKHVGTCLKFYNVRPHVITRGCMV